MTEIAESIIEKKNGSDRQKKKEINKDEVKI